MIDIISSMIANYDFAITVYIIIACIVIGVFSGIFLDHITPIGSAMIAYVISIYIFDDNLINAGLISFGSLITSYLVINYDNFINISNNKIQGIIAVGFTLISGYAISCFFALFITLNFSLYHSMLSICIIYIFIYLYINGIKSIKYHLSFTIGFLIYRLLFGLSDSYVIHEYQSIFQLITILLPSLVISPLICNIFIRPKKDKYNYINHYIKSYKIHNSSINIFDMIIIYVKVLAIGTMNGMMPYSYLNNKYSLKILKNSINMYSCISSLKGLGKSHIKLFVLMHENYRFIFNTIIVSVIYFIPINSMGLIMSGMHNMIGLNNFITDENSINILYAINNLYASSIFVSKYSYQTHMLNIFSCLAIGSIHILILYTILAILLQQITILKKIISSYNFDEYIFFLITIVLLYILTCLDMKFDDLIILISLTALICFLIAAKFDIELMLAGFIAGQIMNADIIKQIISA